MRSNLSIEQKIGQRLTQQQVRFVRLLELNAPEMDEAVERELEDNPALEAHNDTPAEAPRNDSHDYDAPTRRYYTPSSQGERGDFPQFSPRDNSESLADVLRAQVAERNVPADVASTADYIIGNLDNNGWLTRSLPLILTDMAVNQDIYVDDQTGKEALELVRSLDPAGVGADSLADCLLLQLQRMPESQSRNDAIEILSKYFREFSMRHSHRIISGMHISRERLDAANRLILTLNPKPGAEYGGADETLAGVIIPDFTVTNHDGRLSIQVNNRYPELSIEESFAEAMRGMEGRRGRPKKGTEFVVSRYNDAREFIALVRQRQQTLMDVMTAIVNHQKKYFLSGDIYDLRPMTLKDLSAATGMDISAISRATNNKFVAMPGGEVLPLRNFFSGDISDKSDNSDNSDSSDKADTSDKDTLTNRQIESAIKELVDAEDPKHPLSDEKIRKLIAERGFDISRRTIAKYRDRISIPIARLRKQF